MAIVDIRFRPRPPGATPGESVGVQPSGRRQRRTESAASGGERGSAGRLSQRAETQADQLTVVMDIASLATSASRVFSL